MTVKIRLMGLLHVHGKKFVCIRLSVIALSLDAVKIDGETIEVAQWSEPRRLRRTDLVGIKQAT